MEIFIGHSRGPASDDFPEAPPVTKRPMRLGRPSTCTATAPHTSAAFTCRVQGKSCCVLRFISTFPPSFAKCGFPFHDGAPYGLDMTMEEYTVDAFANRDEPVPRMYVGNQEPSRRERLKARFGVNQNGKGSDENNDKSGLSIQDRLFSRYGRFFYTCSLERLSYLSQASAASHSRPRCRAGGR